MITINTNLLWTPTSMLRVSILFLSFCMLGLAQTDTKRSDEKCCILSVVISNEKPETRVIKATIINKCDLPISLNKMGRVFVTLSKSLELEDAVLIGFLPNQDQFNSSLQTGKSVAFEISLDKISWLDNRSSFPYQQSEPSNNSVPLGSYWFTLDVAPFRADWENLQTLKKRKIDVNTTFRSNAIRINF